MSSLDHRISCAGCGFDVSPSEPFPFRCPRAGSGDDADHILTPELELAGTELCAQAGTNPFLRFRELLWSWRLARSRGMADADYVDLVRRLDDAVAAVDGHGFATTPYRRRERLSAALGFEDEGGLWVKDETGNVSGTHKARHLMAIAIYLDVAERTGLSVREGTGPRLAIASCGNAALAAAVVARAADRPLEVFIPTWADETVVERLTDLGADLCYCERSDEDPPGDPCYLRFGEAVRAGYLPFTCQGSENGLTIEGCKTLGWEILCEHPSAPAIDRVAVQVGGGALASAIVQSFRDAHALGALGRLPKFHAVQTEGGHPLERAWRRAVDAVRERLEARGHEAPRGAERDEAALAEWVRAHGCSGAIDEVLAHAATHRSHYMWPWEREPKSMATGILDDETYDWLAILRAMLETGGWPVVAFESTIDQAHELGRDTTGIDVDPTGTAGLAGLLALRDTGALAPTENAAVLFTGVERRKV